MKKIFFVLLLLVIYAPAYAVDCEMGGMELWDYAYFIGILGIVCGLVFVLGINQQ